MVSLYLIIICHTGRCICKAEINSVLNNWCGILQYNMAIQCKVDRINVRIVKIGGSSSARTQLAKGPVSKLYNSITKFHLKIGFQFLSWIFRKDTGSSELYYVAKDWIMQTYYINWHKGVDDQANFLCREKPKEIIIELNSYFGMGSGLFLNTQQIF